MSEPYHALYLSPHLDDVVLSCGGQIAAATRRGERVLVATLMAGDCEGELTPLAREMHAAWKLGNSCEPRREEDRRACARLGADFLHGKKPDAMYRWRTDGTPLYPRLQDVLGPPHPEEAGTTVWEQVLRDLPPAGRVVAPLGVGGHVDHWLVRRAAEKVFGPDLLYYEDFPYATRFLAVRRVVWPPWRWRARMIPLSPEDVRARQEAAALYVSQTEMLLDGAWKLYDKVARYVRRVGGERLWERKR
ncbi:MAG: PIG-L family deacetylase [Lentisphaerae bacterium]|jgi:LmbE family N-acetylglucosaminyl deacetylase|nr:PIG-L family deacetylase [Lentisphaerota bacterium]